MKYGYDNIWKDDGETHYKSDLPEGTLRLFNDKKVKKVLDLGSGDGSIMIFLAEKGFKVSGIEFSEVGVTKARMNAASRNLKIDLIKGDIYEQLPFQTDYFDAVMALQSLNHNTLDKIRMLFAEIKRVLKTGGILVIKTADRSSYNLENIQGDIYLDKDFNEKFKFLDEQTYIPQEGGEKGITHYAFYKDQLISEVTEHDFKLIESQGTRWHIIVKFECTKK